MYRVPSTPGGSSGSWRVLRRFIVASSLVIACLSGILTTGHYMVRYRDFFSPGNLGLFIFVAGYGFVVGLILSTAVHGIVFVAFAPFRRSPPWLRSLAYGVVALTITAAMARAAWDTPAPGEEAVARSRLINLILIPCLLHVAAMLWFDQRRKRLAGGSRPSDRG